MYACIARAHARAAARQGRAGGQYRRKNVCETVPAPRRRPTNRRTGGTGNDYDGYLGAIC
eukprot:9534090-Lingulodinium_polyedra.AAC.1